VEHVNKPDLGVTMHWPRNALPCLIHPSGSSSCERPLEDSSAAPASALEMEI
jgi:hypothetical protein